MSNGERWNFKSDLSIRILDILSSFGSAANAQHSDGQILLNGLDRECPYVECSGTGAKRMIKFHYSDTKQAHPDSQIFLPDAKSLVMAGRKVLANFDALGFDRDSSGDKDFMAFLSLIYASGMVMSGFDGPLFDSGPGRLLNDSTVAAAMVYRANLLTVRMFLHTLARGHRMTWVGEGYPYFAEAYKSGGLRALIDRLDSFCESAEANESEILCGDRETGFDA